MNPKTYMQKNLTILVLFAWISMLVWSATAKSTEPDPSATPMLQQLIKSGAKVYYLGKNAGVDGWFIIKDNQVQIGYVPPENKNLIFGVLIDKDGQSTSALQIKNLYDNNPEVGKLLTNMQTPATPPTQTAPAPSQINSYDMGIPPIPMAASPNPSVPSIAAPAASPGERLLQALQTAAGVNIGAASAPRLSMVVDPNCPHCQAAWRALRDPVFASKLQIRLVPIGEVDPDSERAAAQLLGSANPLEAWDKYIGGDHNQLAGTPDGIRLTAVHNNRLLVDAWHIQMTPYMVYRAKDGQVKIVQGEPQQAAAIVNDIAP